jgi:hypothetical protein
MKRSWWDAWKPRQLSRAQRRGKHISNKRRRLSRAKMHQELADIIVEHIEALIGGPSLLSGFTGPSWEV